MDQLKRLFLFVVQFLIQNDKQIIFVFLFFLITVKHSLCSLGTTILVNGFLVTKRRGVEHTMILVTEINNRKPFDGFSKIERQQKVKRGHG